MYQLTSETYVRPSHARLQLYDVGRTYLPDNDTFYNEICFFNLLYFTMVDETLCCIETVAY